MHTWSIVLLGLSVALTSCGHSDDELYNFAMTTCDTMGQNLIMDLDSARRKIGEEPYSGTYNEILYARQWGICEELVLNDPDYELLASELMEIENHFRPVIRNIKSLNVRRVIQDGNEMERLTKEYQEQVERLRSGVEGDSVETDIEGKIAELNAELERVKREHSSDQLGVAMRFRSEQERIVNLYDTEIERILGQL